jgi:hypothetical protein
MMFRGVCGVPHQASSWAAHRDSAVTSAPGWRSPGPTFREITRVAGSVANLALYQLSNTPRENYKS